MFVLGGTLLPGGSLPGLHGITPTQVSGILPVHGNSPVAIGSPNCISSNSSQMIFPSGALATNPLVTGPMFTGQTAGTGLPPGVVAQLPTATRSALPGQYGLQPMVYWYPSPPVSPQSTYYVQTTPTTVVMKGLSFNTSPQDVLSYFDGIFEVIYRVVFNE